MRFIKDMPVERIVSMFQVHGFDLNKPTANKLLERTASLFDSCKLQKKNYMSYLTDVINKASLIPNGAIVSEYRHLLPDMWQESAVPS